MCIPSKLHFLCFQTLCVCVCRHAIEMILRLIQSLVWHAIVLGLMSIMYQQWILSLQPIPEAVDIKQLNQKLWPLHYTFWCSCAINIICLTYIQTLTEVENQAILKTFKHEGKRLVDAFMSRNTNIESS